MIINNNIPAMNTHRQLGVNQNAMQNSMEKLSSGLRINRAGDDAAGLAISEKMRAQINGLDQASRNAQDGISMIQTAEGALNETHDILQRMRELSVQSANDTNVGVDREEIQKEVDQLASEITRIANNTEFNQQTLVNGGITDTKFQIGANSDQNISLGIKAMDAQSLGVARDGVEATLQTGAANIDNLDLADSVGSGVVDGANIDVSVTATTDEIGSVQVGGADGITVSTVDNTAAYNNYEISIIDGVSEGIAIDHDAGTIGITLDLANTSTTDVSSLTPTVTNGTAPAGAGDLTFTGTAEDATVATDQTMADNGNAGSAAGLTVELDDNDGNVQSLELAADATSVNVASGAFEGISFTSTDLENASGTIEISIQASSAATFNADGTLDQAAVSAGGIDVSSQAAANTAIETLNNAIEMVSAERSNLGATQNRLEHTISNLNNSAENLSAAESRIRDVDMAAEMMEMTRANILSQASQSMLAQANQQPQSVLQLLG